MFARFDENPAMTLQVIKETKRYGRTYGRTDNVKTVYPLQTKFAELNRIFILLPESCPGVGLVGAGGSKTLAWGFAMAPHRLRALVFVCLISFFTSHQQYFS